MDNKSYKLYDIIKIDDKEFRVIGIFKDTVALVELNTTKLVISTQKAVGLYDMLNQGDAIIVNEEPDNKFYEIDKLSESVQNLYKIREKIAVEYQTKFAPLYIGIKTKEGSDFVKKLAETNEKTTAYIWNVIRNYTQSGFDKNSLIDKRHNREITISSSKGKRRGAKSKLDNGSEIIVDEITLEYFEEAKNAFLDGRFKTIKAAYNEMITKHYIGTYVNDKDEQCYGILPTKQRPTIRQFRYYVDHNATKEEIATAKTSAREVRNNLRLLVSDSRLNVTGPGSLWEVDECEADFQLVNRGDRNKVVGKAVVYFMIDVYSSLIVGYSVDFENNSINGITNCLLNLTVDKKELLSEHGLNPDLFFWPDHVLPLRLRSDNGAEYISYEMERICNEIGINAELAPPGTGSYKGIVEQSFHQFQNGLRPLLEHKGLITKRHDSDEKKSATLTIDEFEEFILTFITNHNKSPMNDYPVTLDMRKHILTPSPEEIWKYGVEVSGSLKPIRNEDKFKYALLTPIKAGISRKGIYFKDLYYYDDKNKLLQYDMKLVGDKRKPLEARIDPRSVECIYFLRDEEIVCVPLNPNKTANLEYADYSLKEYEQIHSEKALQDLKNAQTKIDLDIAALTRNQNIINKIPTSYIPSSKNIKENRKDEKKMLAKEHKIFKTDDTQTIPNESKKKESTKIVSLEEALSDYEKNKFE